MFFVSAKDGWIRYLTHPMGVKILVVEDDAMTAQMMRDILTTQGGYDLKFAATGWDAWKMLTGFRDGFDVVILDLTLPELSGLDLLKRIKQSDTLKLLPIIVCTGKNDRETVGQVLAFGIRHYVVKPINAPILLAKLADVVANLSNPGTATKPSPTS